MTVIPCFAYGHASLVTNNVNDAHIHGENENEFSPEELISCQK
jgi:hypothetical protein